MSDVDRRIALGSAHCAAGVLSRTSGAAAASTPDELLVHARPSQYRTRPGPDGSAYQPADKPRVRRAPRRNLCKVRRIHDPTASPRRLAGYLQGDKGGGYVTGLARTPFPVRPSAVGTAE